MAEAGLAEPNPPSIRGNILVVDDDAQLRVVYEQIFSARGHRVDTAGDAPEALRTLEREPFDLVLTDVRMPGMSGHELLKQIEESFDDTLVVVLTGYGDVEGAVRAMKSGAYEYLTKPVLVDRLIQVVERGLSRLRSVAPGTATDDPGAQDVRSPVMRKLLRQLHRVAATDAALLLIGEPGTGKATMARHLHRRSARADGPFVRFEHCGLSESRAERELLGYAGGDGGQARPGVLEQASGGTLYVPHAGALPPRVQGALHRVLADGRVTLPGGREPRPVRVRVVSGACSNLRDEMDAGQFRRDLFYRLATVELSVPPLRERPEDIGPLAEQFLQEACQRLQRAPRYLSPRALELLMGYRWPGNLRQLRGVLERAVVTSSRRILRPRDIALHHEERQPALTRTMREMERKHVEDVLRRANGNKSRAAALLGVSRPTLYRKLRQFGLLEAAQE